MREIKFRAWDKNYKKMYQWRNIQKWDFSSVKSNEHITMLQYTGLKDKNGRDIYEGDIITSGTSYNLEVFWMGVAWGVRWKDMGNDEEAMIHDDGGDMGMD